MYEDIFSGINNSNLTEIKTYIRTKEVVVVLPYVENKVLMQLREFKSYIVFPGKWGFLGGSVEDGEEPKEAAWRELFEEIGYRPADLHKLGTEQKPELGNIISHSFFCSLTTPVEELVLNEGLDLGLFKLEEIMTKELYSRKMERSFPVIPSKYIVSTIQKLLTRLNKTQYIVSV